MTVKYKEGLVFNTIVFDVNQKTFIPYNILPRLVRDLEAWVKRHKVKEIDKETLKTTLTKLSMSNWWGRCEYEILLVDFPCEDITRKIDVHYQICNNIDIITDIIYNNCITIRKRKKV